MTNPSPEATSESEKDPEPASAPAPTLSLPVPLAAEEENHDEDKDQQKEKIEGIQTQTQTLPTKPEPTPILTPSTVTAATATPTPTLPTQLPLDWTTLGNNEITNEKVNKIRYPSDVMELSNDPEETYLEIIGTAGQKITHMGKDLHRQCSPNLTHLIFRSHLIVKMEGFEKFRKLELLELYDNSIEYLDGLGPPGVQPGEAINHKNPSSTNTNDADDEDNRCVGDTLTVLDMSYNAIREMQPVSFCPNLTELYLANNKIKTLSGIQNLTKLRKIDLGANRIRTMDPDQFTHLTQLEELWIGKNKIETIDGLSTLVKLRRLDVQSNRLTHVDADMMRHVQDTLEELYLGHNGIEDEGIVGLRDLEFKVLSMVDMSRNRLNSCRGFVNMKALDTLWLSGNDIKTFEDVEPIAELGRVGHNDVNGLDEIYLEHNPIYQEEEYRSRLKEMLPSLNQIDAIRLDGGYGGFVAPPPVPTVGDVASQLKLWQDRAIAKAKLEKETRAAAGILKK